MLRKMLHEVLSYLQTDLRPENRSKHLKPVCLFQLDQWV